MKQRILLFCAVVLVAAGAAFLLTTDHRTFDLEKEYGVNWQHDHTLTVHGYTYTTAKAKFPAWIDWCEQQGWSQAEVMGQYEFECAWNDAFWRGNGYFTEVPVFGDVTRSRLHIVAPHGAFHVTYPCLFNQGIYEGQGAGNYSGTQGQSTGGTGIYLDNANWMVARSPERFCLKSITWGSASGYAECFTVKHFRFEGGRTSLVNDPSFIAAGMGIWDSGEASGVEYCYAFGFNSYGFMNVRGTPSAFDHCSSFSNGIYGFGLIGNDLSTVTMIGCSGDDNQYLYGIIEGYGRPGGSTFATVGSKSESGKRQPPRKQGLLYGRGALNAVVDGASLDATDGTVYAIDVDFQGYNGQVDVRGIRHNGVANALRLTAKGKTTIYASPGNVTPYSYVANETGVVWSTRTMTPSGATTPPPTTCTWTPGPKTCGACTGTTMPCTVTYVSTVAGCTPTSSKPSDIVTTEACSVTPPTIGKDFGPYTITTANTTLCVQVNVPAVTSITVTMKPTAFTWGRLAGTGAGKASLQVGTDGFLYWNGSKCSSSKFTLNTTSTVVATIPATTILFLFQTDCAQGGAQQGTGITLNLK